MISWDFIKQPWCWLAIDPPSYSVDFLLPSLNPLLLITSLILYHTNPDFFLLRPLTYYGTFISSWFLWLFHAVYSYLSIWNWETQMRENMWYLLCFVSVILPDIIFFLGPSIWISFLKKVYFLQGFKTSEVTYVVLDIHKPVYIRSALGRLNVVKKYIKLGRNRRGQDIAWVGLWTLKNVFDLMTLYPFISVGECQ